MATHTVTSCWSHHGKAIEMAVAQQFIVLLCTALLLDGGEMLRLSLFAVAAHWALILIVLMRRPHAPTRLDLGLIGFGFIPVGLASLVVAGCVGRILL